MAATRDPFQHVFDKLKRAAICVHVWTFLVYTADLHLVKSVMGDFDFVRWRRKRSFQLYLADVPIAAAHAMPVVRIFRYCCFWDAYTSIC